MFAVPSLVRKYSVVLVLFAAMLAGCAGGEETALKIQIYIPGSHQVDLCNYEQTTSVFRIGAFETTSNGLPTSTILWKSEFSAKKFCSGDALALNPKVSKKPVVVVMEALNKADFQGLPERAAVLGRGVAEHVVWDGTKKVEVPLLVGKVANYTEVIKGRKPVQLSSGVRGVTATTLADHRVLILGGMTTVGSSPKYFADAYIYDPATMSISKLPENAGHRAFHTATLLDDGRVLIVGGKTRVGAGEGTNPEVYLFDPNTMSFSMIGTLPKGRAWHRAVKLLDGSVLIVGGEDYATGQPEPLSDAYLFNPADNSITAVGSMAKPRADFGATLLSDGRVMVQGGVYLYSSGMGITTASVEFYDPNSRSFVPGPDFDNDSSYKEVLSRRGHILLHLEAIAQNPSAPCNSDTDCTGAGEYCMDSVCSHYVERVAVIGGLSQPDVTTNNYYNEVYVLNPFDNANGVACTLYPSAGTFDRMWATADTYVVSKKPVYLVSGGQSTAGIKRDGVIFALDPNSANGPFCDWGRTRLYGVIESQPNPVTVPMNAERVLHASTNMHNGEILLVGGGRAGAEVGTLEMYIVPVYNNGTVFTAYEY